MRLIFLKLWTKSYIFAPFNS